MFLARMLTGLPGPNRWDEQERHQKNFLQYLRKKGKKTNSHPIFPGLSVDDEFFRHLFNIQMHQCPQSKMAPFGTFCLTPQKIKKLRENFLELYSSSEEFVMCMTCTEGIFIKMLFTRNVSGVGYQLAFQVFGGTRSLFQTKVDVTLEKGTSKFQIYLKIHQHHQYCIFFYDEYIFFPIPFSIGMYSEERAKPKVVSFYQQGIHQYKPNLDEQKSLKRVKM